MKFCRDCKWYFKIADAFINPIGGFRDAHRCKRPETDVVTGVSAPTDGNCYSMRTWNSLGCGVEGRWFEPKEDK